MSIDVPTRIVATFAPDHVVHMFEAEVEPRYLVSTGRVLVPFDKLGDAIALCLHNCGWGDFTIEEPDAWPTYGEQTSCRYCDLDVEYHDAAGWLDRGGNSKCPESMSGAAERPHEGRDNR